MLNEGRKRDAAANALLGLAFAASAAQSPKDLVRSGHIEGPGMQLMSRMMTKRKEANRNLDSGRVSHPARNVKKKTFKEFVEEIKHISLLEVNRPEKDSDVEKARWDKVRATIDARENPSDWIVGVSGRDKNGVQTYTIKSAGARRNQGKNRASKLKDVDADLDPKQKSRGDAKATIIKGRGKEAHHGTSISQSAQEFKGLTPEQRKEKREKDAKFGKFHGSDPRNLIQTDGPKGGKGIPHRGADGYHSSQKPVGKGGSIQDIGSEKEIVAAKRRVARQGSAVEKLAKEKGIETPKMQRQRELRARMSAYAKASGYN